MIISCPNCHKRYQLSHKSAHPPPVIQCPACKAKISLTPLSSEKKEMIHGIYQMTCPGCQKVYRIPIDRIPAGKTRARCKVCGQGIDLRPLLHKKPVAPLPRTAVAGKVPTDLPQPRISKPVPRKPTTQETKPRRRAVTASIVGVLVVLVVLVWAYGPHHAWKSKDIAPNLVLPEILDPVASLQIDVPALMALLKQQSEIRKPSQRVLAFLEQMEHLKLTHIDLAVYPDTNHGALAVLALRGRRETLRHRLLAEDALLGPFIEKVSDGIYRFKATAFAKQPVEKVPLDLYELRLVDGDCIVAPRALIDLLPEGLDLITHAPVTRFAATLKQPNHVVDFAIRLPAEWRTGWEQKLAGHPVLKEIPNAGIFTGAGVTLVQQLAEPFQQLEYMALGLAVGEHQRRLLSYAQQFRPEIDGAAIYQKLQNRNAHGAPGVLSGVLDILADPLFETGARFSANRLSINIGWDEKDDQAVLAALSSAAMGQLAAHSMIRGAEPTRGPIKTVYAAAPHLVSEVDEDRLKRELPKRIGKGLFPDEFSLSGTEPSLTFMLDPVPIPNAVLAEVDYDVLSIQAPDGHSILRKDDQTFKPPIDLTGRYSSRIRLDVLPGTQAKDLGAARLHFNIAAPTALNIFKFKAAAGPSTQKSDHGVQVAAERIERDIAQVSVKGGASIWLFAFDDTGRALSAKEAMGTSQNKFVRFSGVVETLQVVTAVRMLHHAFDIDVQLHGGRKIELRRKPETPPRVRLDLSPVSQYALMTTEDLASMKVEWVEGDRIWKGPHQIEILFIPINVLF